MSLWLICSVSLIDKIYNVPKGISCNPKISKRKSPIFSRNEDPQNLGGHAVDRFVSGEHKASSPFVWAVAFPAMRRIRDREA